MDTDFIHSNSTVADSIFDNVADIHKCKVTASGPKVRLLCEIVQFGRSAMRTAFHIFIVLLLWGFVKRNFVKIKLPYIFSN